MLKLRKLIPAVVLVVMPILIAVNEGAVFATDFSEVTGLGDDGTFEVFMAPPTNMSEQYALNEMINELTDGNYGITTMGEWKCNDGFTSCKLAYHGEWADLEYGITYYYSEKAKEMVDALMAEIELSDDGYLVHDMELLQYWAYQGELLPAFSSEVKSVLKNKNVDLRIDVRMGGNEPLMTLQGGEAKVYYEDVLYYVNSSPVTVYAPHIFYVDDEATDLAEALKQRIAGIFGEEALDVVSVETSEEKVSDYMEDTEEDHKYFDDYVNEKLHDLCLTDGKTRVCMKILILKDSSKLFTPVGVNSTDLLTNVNITADAANLPADAATYTMVIGNEDFKEMEEALGTDEFYSYELGLYSASLGEEVRDNDDKEFVVSIPVPEVLEGIEQLSAYWLNYETGELEEHYADIVNGNAVFDTTHFSTYTLAASSADRPVVPGAPDTGVFSKVTGGAVVAVTGLMTAFAAAGCVVVAKNRR